MGTDNKSPSYLEERGLVRKWLTTTPEGKYTADLLKSQDGASVVSQVLDDDQWVDWDSMLQEHKNDLAVAANCSEVRNAVDLARKSNSLNAPPMSKGAKWIRFFSPPMWYHLRRQIETMDPDFWNDPKNVLREAIEHQEWATVPAVYLRAELERYLGTSEKRALSLPNPGPKTEVVGS